VSDLDLQYLSGELAVMLYTSLPIKSGRRKAILSAEHCQMSFADLDLDRLKEYSSGKLFIFTIFWIFKTIPTNKPFLARTHEGGPLRLRLFCGSNETQMNFLEVRTRIYFYFYNSKLVQVWYHFNL